MEIIPMTRQHVTQVAALEKLCFSAPWSEASVAGELDNPLSVWLVCVDRGKVLGYVGSQTVLEESDMMNIAVLPEARRAGMGERLILSLIELLKDRGSRSLALEVRASNTPAISLYKKLGFLQVGRRPNYYRGPREDALIFRKEWQA